jgi:hypothetical protein
MSTFKYSIKAAGVVLASSLAISTSAQALTLDTTFVAANSVFSLSQEAWDAMTAASTGISALGIASNATPVKSSTGDLLPSFNLPISKVDVSLGLNPLVTPNYGEASGSALQISRGSKSVVLANFAIDYSHDLVLADITANGVTTKATSLYSFDPTDLKIGLSGLTLNMHQTLSNLMFTDSALATFSSGLSLGKALTAGLASIDFGSITIDINGALRSPINAKPYVASLAAVPEAPPASMITLGLIGIAAVSSRKRRT